jgi:hypothetical protein
MQSESRGIAVTDEPADDKESPGDGAVNEDAPMSPLGDEDTKYSVSEIIRVNTLEVAARHEVGHACMAAHLGYKVHHCVFGHSLSKGAFGVATYNKPEDVNDLLLILTAGVVALFLHDEPAAKSPIDFAYWIEGNIIKALSGISDWNRILRLTGNPACNLRIEYWNRAILPYYERTAAALRQEIDKIDAITEYALDHLPGIGPRAFKALMSGRKPTWTETLLDYPEVRDAALRERKGKANR